MLGNVAGLEVVLVCAPFHYEILRVNVSSSSMNLENGDNTSVVI
jgi:hypothetical protein